MDHTVPYLTLPTYLTYHLPTYLPTYLVSTFSRYLRLQQLNCPSTIDRPTSNVHHPTSTIHHPPSTIHHPPSTIHHPPSFLLLPPSHTNLTNYLLFSHLACCFTTFDCAEIAAAAV
jgi:hypothetical protein